MSLKGGVFKIQKNICAILSHIASGEACAHDKRTKREKERPERAASSEPRATPWVSVYKRLRPVRAKVRANGWLLLLPLQGVGNGDMIPRALPWAMNLLGFQPAQSRRANIRRSPGAKHCSSLCSQSEGDEYCGGQTRLKIQQSHALKR